MNDYRVVDCAAPFDGSSDDFLRREYHLNRRSIWIAIRDLWRGYADVDLLSYDAKANRLRPVSEYTAAEMKAAYERRRKWANTY